ncbi:MAG: response regulator, partial [Spirochaetia bacterium]|nr:response regulator [Spirochaetia bacterium]
SCNPYLLVDEGQGVLFDPGSVLDVQEVLESISSVLPLDKIRYVVLHHQDPDLAAAVPAMEAAGMKFEIVTHWRSWSLIRFYGVRSSPYLVDEHGYSLKLESGRTLQFIPTPYLHFPGAIASYDKRAKFLLSSDLFGSFSENWSLYADGNYMEGMKRFHEHYMPSNAVLRPTMELLSCLELDAILPQHGSIITKNIPVYIDALKNLECGIALNFGLKGDSTSPDYHALGKEVQRLKELNEQLLKTASQVSEAQIRDATTGLYDESFFREFIDEQASLRLYSEGVEDDVLAVFGIDEGMAKIEYQYGPKEVEVILKGVARILLDSKLSSQPAFRLHGTTFVLWMPQIAFHKAVELCEQIRNKVESAKSFIEKITVSAGLVALVEVRSTISDPSEAGAIFTDTGIRRLRLARKRGGNVVCTSSEVSGLRESRAKILVVDDNMIHARVVKTFLENSGYSVFIAKDGAEALRLIAQEGFDLIIAELMVPKVDGFFLKENLAAKSGTKDIPFILLSHRKNEDSIKQAYGQGVRYYLQKPYLMAELLGIVNNLTKGGTV